MWIGPGSGKSTLAEPAELIGGIHINADAVRKQYDDWDFTLQGLIRQAQRMRPADGIVMAGKIAIADFICPTQSARTEFAADYTVWMDTVKECEYEDTNSMFEPLQHVITSLQNGLMIHMQNLLKLLIIIYLPQTGCSERL